MKIDFSGLKLRSTNCLRVIIFYKYLFFVDIIKLVLFRYGLFFFFCYRRFCSSAAVAGVLLLIGLGAFFILNQRTYRLLKLTFQIRVIFIYNLIKYSTYHGFNSYFISIKLTVCFIINLLWHKK